MVWKLSKSSTFPSSDVNYNPGFSIKGPPPILISIVGPRITFFDKHGKPPKLKLKKDPEALASPSENRVSVYLSAFQIRRRRKPVDGRQTFLSIVWGGGRLRLRVSLQVKLPLFPLWQRSTLEATIAI